MLWPGAEAVITWTDKLTAISTAATFGVLALSGFLALRQLRETERTRYGELIADLSRRWDEPYMRTSRLTTSKMTSFEIGLVVLKMYRGRATPVDENAFYELQALTNFLEALSVIESDVRGLELDLISTMWGSTIVAAWEKWERATLFMRRRSSEPNVYANLERLVRRVEELEELQALWRLERQLRRLRVNALTAALS
jgi:hypothetical protein